jgi:hypothetical protein
MIRALARALCLALLGAVCGPVFLSALFARDPTFSLDVGRDLPRFATGFHVPERGGDRAFVWTTARATVALSGLDRRTTWTCAVSFRGARRPPATQPVVSIAIDGVTRSSDTATNSFHEIALAVPARPDAPGLTMTIASAPAFVPGGGDRRELGVQVDRLICRPDGFVRPPSGALSAAAVSGALIGAMLGMLALPALWAAAATVAIAAAVAFALFSGPAPYSSYPATVAWTTFWVLLATGACGLLVRGWRRRPLSTALRAALALSAASLLLELIALLHPSKLMVDALFHAHRLEWVLGGRYFFTQPMPDGVQFPYAIALYVMAAPFSILTHDYVSLLKIVVSVARACAGLALYPMVARSWDNRAAAALAVALFHIVPLPFIVIGNANLTYAFGQSMATLALAAAATAVPQSSAWRAVILTTIAAVAFLSHVGVFPLLALMLLMLGVLYRLVGGLAMRRDARIVIGAAVLAAVCAVGLYYGRFGESYATLERVRTRDASTANAAAPEPGQPESAETPRAPAPARGVGERVVRAVDLAGRSFGWATLALAAAGAWLVWRSGSRDRVTLLLVATAAVYVVFVGLSVTAPIRPGFQRYAEEFISRVNYLAIAAVAVLAARGAVWAFHAGLFARLIAAGLLLAATGGAVHMWLGWIS